MKELLRDFLNVLHSADSDRGCCVCCAESAHLTTGIYNEGHGSASLVIEVLLYCPSGGFIWNANKHVAGAACGPGTPTEISDAMSTDIPLWIRANGSKELLVNWRTMGSKCKAGDEVMWKWGE